MAKQAKKPYAITVILSGRTNNFDKSNPDGTFTFKPIGNKRTTETSAVAAVKRTCALCGCKVEKIVKIEKLEV